MHNNRTRKSIGAETTFNTDLVATEEMLARLQLLAEKVVGVLQKKKLVAKTITLKVKFADFQQVTRSHTEQYVFHSMDVILRRLPQLLDKTEAGARKVRLLGVSVSNLTPLDGEDPKPEQITLL